jgi:hypothetical protein
MRNFLLTDMSEVILNSFKTSGVGTSAGQDIRVAKLFIAIL